MAGGIDVLFPFTMGNGYSVNLVVPDLNFPGPPANNPTWAMGPSFRFDGPADPTTAPDVPEPASMPLLGTGLIKIAGRAWRKRKP
jgi:hypothetical protein